MPVDPGTPVYKTKLKAKPPVKGPPASATTRDNHPGYKQTAPKGPPAPTHDPHAPVPILAAHGFSGGIESWNQRVQKVHDAYTSQHGKEPSPGLMFDVARSPNVMDNQIHPTMMDVPQTGLRANARAAVAQEAMDGKTTSVRPDGYRDPDNHYKTMIPLIDHPHADYPNYKSFLTAKGGKYQMTQLGGVPFALPGGIPGVADLWKAAALTSDPKVIAQFGTMTPEEADKVLAARKLQSSSLVSAFDDTSAAGQVSGGETVYAKAIKNLSQVQDLLIKAAPYKFAGLKVTGVMSKDWINAYSSWSRSDDFGMQNMKYYAKLNAFPQTDRGIAQMNKAWHLQTKLMNDPKNVLYTHLIQSIPLRVLSNVNFEYGYPHDPVQFLKNIWGYMDEGNSSLPVVHQLQDAWHGVKLGMSLGSGVFTTVKSDMLYTATLARLTANNILGGNMTRDDMAKVLVGKLKENPSWLKVMSAGTLTDQNEPGFVKGIDGLSNFAVDLYLGIKFANPAFEVIANTKTAAEKSVAVNSSSKLAYNAIKAGDLRQAVRDLHGGDAARRFVVAVESYIHEGMDFATFRGHVTDLYGNFTTTIKPLEKAVTKLEEESPGKFPPETNGDLFKEPKDVPTIKSELGKGKDVPKPYDLKFRRRPVWHNVKTGETHVGPIDGEHVDALPPGYSRDGYQLGQEKPGDAGWMQATAVVEDGKVVKLNSNELNPQETIKAFEDAKQSHAVSVTPKVRKVARDEGTVVEGAGILGKYASPTMRNMGRGGFAARTVIRQVSHLGDQIEREALNLRLNGYSGPLGAAEKMIRGSRSMFSTVIPTGRREIFADNFANNLHTFLVGNSVMSRDAATKLTNDFIRARAAQDIGKMDDILTEAHGLFRQKFPVAPGQKDPSIFDNLEKVETEQLSGFNFPTKSGIKGKETASDAVEAAKTAGEAAGVPSPFVEFGGSVAQAVRRSTTEPIEATVELANSVNTLLNRITKVWRTIQLVKNVGRFWKHATRDPMAAFLGGYRPLEKGFEASAAEAKAYMDKNPAIFRQFSTARGRSTLSELHWLSGEFWVDGQNAWNMKDFYAAPKHELAGRLTGAQEYARKLLTSDAYDAYINTASKDDLGPLVDAILGNKGIKNAMWQNRKVLSKFRLSHSEMVESGISPRHQLTLDDEFAGRAAKGQINLDEAHRYAEKLFDRYHELEKAVHESGGDLHDLWQILHTDPGLADSKVGAYLKKFNVPVQVHDGTMVVRNSWDAWSENIIKAYMKPNFFSRGKMFDSSFNSLYASYRAAGAEVPDAIQAAAHTAEQVTVKHMLDFTNQLQFEQKFRWLFPFFTKHRLYVGWLISIAREYPALSVPVSDIGQHIDRSGNVNFNVFGLPLKINVLRQMWLNNEDQPATVPASMFIPGLEKQAGAWFGGTGEAAHAVYKLAFAHTYEAATRGMSASALKQFDKSVISFGINWQQQHPGQPIPESSAVRYGLARYAAYAFVNDTSFTPIGVQSAALPSRIQKLSDQYTALYAQSPAKASDFLDKHPEVGLSFGIYKDTNVFWHNQGMFAALRDIQAKRDAVEAPLVRELQRTGDLSPEGLAAMQQASQDYGTAYRQLLVNDATSWTRTDVPGFPPGRVENGRVVVNGPFGVGQNTSDAAQAMETWIQKIAPNLPKHELTKIWGQEQDVEQARLDQLPRNPKGPDADAINTERTYLNKVLAPYRNLPKDPTGQIRQAYFDAREKWFVSAAKIRAEAKNSSGSQKQELEDQLRLIDGQSQLDSSFTYQGKKYQGPPFAVSSYIDRLTPPQKVTWVLKNLVNASYDNLSSTDKIILGVGNSNPLFDAAWVAYHAQARAYKDGQDKTYHGPVSGYQQYYAHVIDERMTTAGHPGFYTDWLNSTKPKYQLIQQYKPIQLSHYKTQWNELLTVAAAAYHKTSSWKEGQRVTYWHYQVAPTVLKIIQGMPQGFQDELAVASGGGTGAQKFVFSLMSSANSVKAP